MALDRVKIVSNVMNPDLYQHSRSFYESMRYGKIAVNGAGGCFGINFLNHIITNGAIYDFDWMIYVDEDCFITNPSAVEELLEYQVSNGYACCGMPDGGVVSIRARNPVSINPFFMIMNLGEIRKRYNSDQVMGSRYGGDLDQYIPKALMKPNIGTLFDNYEGYYRLFFWLLRNGFKLLYLDAEEYSGDQTTAMLKNHKGEVLAYHTWYARMWNRDQKHTQRIRGVIKHCRGLVGIDGYGSSGA